MSQIYSEKRPTWVVDLNNPPLPKSRNSGIVDPPGFQSQTSSTSKVSAPPFLSPPPSTPLPLASCHQDHCSDPDPLSQTQKQNASKNKPRQPQTPEEMDTLKVKKAWEVALGPVKGLPMTAIMMYMSGNTLQIFSIMMVVMAFKNPIMGIVSTNQAFARFESETNRSQIVPVKLLYVAMQFLALAVGVWKINSMGLLP